MGTPAAWVRRAAARTRSMKVLWRTAPRRWQWISTLGMARKNCSRGVVVVVSVVMGGCVLGAGCAGQAIQHGCAQQGLVGQAGYPHIGLGASGHAPFQHRHASRVLAG